MCEQCGPWKVWGEPLNDEDEDEDEYDCKWIGDESENFELCEQLASCIVYERYVENHLCQEHMNVENQYLDEGFGDFLRSVGLQKSVDFLPIQAEESCDFVDPLSLLDDDPTRPFSPCDKRAMYAKMVIEADVLCDGHAAQMGYSPR